LLLEFEIISCINLPSLWCRRQEGASNTIKVS